MGGGRPKIFTDEQLIDALIQYEKVSYNKIMIPDLIKWSEQNIEGFKNKIKPHHFYQSKEFKIKLDEINKMRSISVQSQENILLSSSSVNKFFELSKANQIDQVVKARKLFEEISSSNIYLTRTNSALKKELKKNESEVIELYEKQKEIVKNQNKLMKKMDYILKKYNEQNGKEALQEIGIEDGIIDLEKYSENLADVVGDFDKKIKQFYMDNSYIELKRNIDLSNNSDDDEFGQIIDDIFSPE